MPEIPADWQRPETSPFDFVIVGAGAGGAPLAARLAERGYTVLLAEMGPEKPPKPADALVENTDVPLLHPEVTEDPRHALRFFVRHFDGPAAASLDPKVHAPLPGSPAPHPEDEAGVFYPRAQGVGGCAIHNAMIIVSGPAEDWDHIAEATGDPSWRGDRMRAYFERLEHCHYNRPGFFGRVRRFFGLSTGWEDGRHGARGWLQTTMSDLRFLFRDRRLAKVVLEGAYGAARAGVANAGELARSLVTGRVFPSLDPNHAGTIRRSEEGLARIPTSITPDGFRSGPRERLLAVRDHHAHGPRLHLLTGVCATTLAFAEGALSPQVIGVWVLPQEHVYEADPAARAAAQEGWEGRQLRVCCKPGGEVILCGGTFNTPQLLMLSGIGPKEHLAAHGIPVRADVPGVGLNLQDRYEVPVVATMTDGFDSLTDFASTSREPAASKDPHLARWRNNPRQDAFDRGLYGTNGGLISIFRRSAQEDSVPDLFIFALPGYFPGYHVGYSLPLSFVDKLSPAEAAQRVHAVLSSEPGSPARQAAEAQRTADDEQALREPKRTVTWLLLKARTRQHGGEVRLRSASPFRRPDINFHSFPDGDRDRDALALAEGVRFVQDFLDRAKAAGLVESHRCPGLDAPPFSGDLLKWVRNVAWGHHACGTCRIGNDERAVLDSRLRVRGVKGLRVADASVFPRIPGVFIVANVYMVAEKAADVLAEDHYRDPAALPPECRRALRDEPVIRSRAEYEARRVYPAELEAREAELIRTRRATAALPQSGDAT
ncbi:GMC oxidoreductase [Gemmata sp. JC717]|uniref:GMC family oxidoreductase n=1 Tax=Gemmata algarum TaxID=2975278 RepID=UPI0021BACD8F|nr:GMC oxidoreductase [Gemmata algarum]MDY3552366.1 GMC oxidoreductase [Gemmata algarum]